MQKYNLQRCLFKVERKEIAAKDWNDAVKQLKEFMQEPIPDDCVLEEDYCHAEYCGELN